MKINIKFLQTGGVPLTNDLMDTLQSAYETFSCMADLAGNLTIISGCDITGSTVSDGVVAINGEFLPFYGGTISPKVFIGTEEIYKTFEDQTDKILIEKKFVRFGQSVPGNTFDWSDFLRLKTLREIVLQLNSMTTQSQITAIQNEIELLKLKTAPIQNGGIVFIWKKPASEIPLGWKECTDFSGKTIVGLDSFDNDFKTLGAAVGQKYTLLTANHIPKIDIGWVGNNGSGWPDGSADSTTPGAVQSYPRHSKMGTIGQNYVLPVTAVQPSRIVNFIEPNFQ